MKDILGVPKTQMYILSKKAFSCFFDPSNHQERRPMTRIALDIPDESLLDLKLAPEAFGEELRMAAAMKLYEPERLSSGAAARLAGVPRVVFLSKLAEYGIDTFRQTEEGLRREARLA